MDTSTVTYAWIISSNTVFIRLHPLSASSFSTRLYRSIDMVCLCKSLTDFSKPEFKILFYKFNQLFNMLFPCTNHTGNLQYGGRKSGRPSSDSTTIWKTFPQMAREKACMTWTWNSYGLHLLKAALRGGYWVSGPHRHATPLSNRGSNQSPFMYALR